MRVGDIVKYLDSGHITRVATVTDGYSPGTTTQGESMAWPHCWEIATVSDLFREAGFPVPEGARLVFSNQFGRTWAWCHKQSDNGVFVDAAVWRIDESYMSWITGNVKLENFWAFDFPDLSRLPAADAWDCLPDSIKAVVR